MKRLVVAGVYLVGFWTIYPVAEAVAWTWERWDRLHARRHDGVHASSTWYTG